MMDLFWSGFEKQAGLWSGVKSVGRQVVGKINDAEIALKNNKWTAKGRARLAETDMWNKRFADQSEKLRKGHAADAAASRAADVRAKESAALRAEKPIRTAQEPSRYDRERAAARQDASDAMSRPDRYRNPMDHG